MNDLSILRTTMPCRYDCGEDDTNQALFDCYRDIVNYYREDRQIQQGQHSSLEELSETGAIILVYGAIAAAIAVIAIVSHWVNRASRLARLLKQALDGKLKDPSKIDHEHFSNIKVWRERQSDLAKRISGLNALFQALVAIDYHHLAPYKLAKLEPALDKLDISVVIDDDEGTYQIEEVPEFLLDSLCPASSMGYTPENLKVDCETMLETLEKADQMNQIASGLKALTGTKATSPEEMALVKAKVAFIKELLEAFREQVVICTRMLFVMTDGCKLVKP